MTPARANEYHTIVIDTLTILKATNQYEQVFSHIVDRIVRLYGCQTCAIIVVDPDTEYLHVANSYGLSLTFEKAFHRKLATGAIGKLLWTGKSIFIPESTLQPQLSDDAKLEHPFGSCICVQIAIDHRTLGYLHADTKRPNGFEEGDIRTLQSLADFAGIALHKARLHDENLRLDTVDHETGLEKYARFLEQLSASIARAETTGESLALMILDIDNYKHVVHTYGYETSKQLLKEWAGVIKARLRPIDAVGRYGFDEAIILRENSSLELGLAFAEELRTAIETTEFTRHRLRTTVSIGIAAYPLTAATQKELLLSTKEALYEAQRGGRNRVKVAG